MPSRGPLSALPLLAALVLSGCADGGRDVVDTGAGSPATTTTTTPTSSPEPTGRTSPPSAEPTAASPAPSFPPAATEVRQGDEVWAVYLAVARTGEDGRADDPSGDLARAREQAADAGYGRDVGGGQVECDQGAREALGLDPDRDYLTVSIFFATRADADQFIAAYEPGVVGRARIQAYCLD